MLAPEIKGRDCTEAEAANKTTTGARACTRNGRQWSLKRARANVDLLKSRF